MKYLVMAIILGSVFLVKGACAEDAVLGLNDYVQNTLKVKSDPNRAVYYVSCLYVYYRLEAQFDPENATAKDKLSTSEGGCVASLMKDVNDSTKVNKINENPSDAGCWAGATTFYNVHSGIDRKKFMGIVGDICVSQ